MVLWVLCVLENLHEAFKSFFMHERKVFNANFMCSFPLVSVLFPKLHLWNCSFDVGVIGLINLLNLHEIRIYKLHGLETVFNQKVLEQITCKKVILFPYQVHAWGCWLFLELLLNNHCMKNCAQCAMNDSQRWFYCVEFQIQAFTVNTLPIWNSFPNKHRN